MGGGRCSAHFHFPPPMLGLAPRDLPGSASEENARPSHLVGLHRARNPASGSRFSRQTFRSLSRFLRIHFLCLLTVPHSVFFLSLATATLPTHLLGNGISGRFDRVRCSLRDLPRGIGRLSRDGANGSQSAGSRVSFNVYESPRGNLE